MKNLIRVEEEHIKIFNKNPYIIGIYWNNVSLLTQNIAKAIKDNKPYDERNLLSKEELKAYEKGELVF